ncbi:MAG: hypothetical protein DI586_01345 [Micavibrio aeruginosavorus]|uniref:Chalcone isomerase domain-containing protein n=1 Tax=Micavibrio aeruginosavorus TaxID=349221 RepID=A0A2W5HG71_9BACT|nr:MAG: hypothetical protein DI586_01345 [Micavibrio aeruginosavorus]
MDEAGMIKKTVMPAKAGISLSFFREIPACAGMTLILLLANPAQAAPFTYTSPNCDFTAAFPEKPFIEKKCVADKCEEIATFVHTIDSSAVNFRLSCHKVDPKDISLLTPDDLKKRLSALIKEAGLMPYAADAAIIKDGIKTSIAMATGRRGEQDVIYTGQMWVGKNSILTMEGEMTGPENQKINDMYGDILKDVQIRKTP